MTFLAIYLLTIPNATAQTLGLLTFIGQIAGFLLEVPSGYISDKLGHKNAIVVARLAALVSTVCFLIADSTLWFYLGVIFLSMSSAFMSGTIDALLHDTLAAQKREHLFAKITGKMRSIGFAVPIIFILGLPFLAEESFRLAFAAVLVIDVVGLLVALSFVSPPTERSTGETSVKNLLSIIPVFFKMPWARFVIINTLVFGIVFGATANFKNPYQEMLGFSLPMLGVLWAASRVFISLLLLINGQIHDWLTYKQFILVKAVVYAASLSLVWVSPNIWVVAVGFLVSSVIMFGLGATNSQYNLAFITNSETKATLLSMSSFLQTLFSAFAGLAMGAIVLSSSFAHGYFYAVVATVLVTVFALFFLKNT